MEYCTEQLQEELLSDMRSHNYVAVAVLVAVLHRGAVQLLYVFISTSLLLNIRIEHSPKAARICEIFGCSAISSFLPLLSRSGKKGTKSGLSSEVLVMDEGEIEGLYRHKAD